MSPDTWIQVLPTHRVALPVQNARPQAARRLPAVRSFRIELADLGRRTANFFSGVWREIKESFLPVHALGNEQLQCTGYLRKAGIGEQANRLALGREMARVFNREYHRISEYGVLGCKETRRKASEAAAKAVVKIVVNREKAAGRRISKEARDQLRQSMESLKDGPQPAIQSNRLGKTGNWAGKDLPIGNLQSMEEGPPPAIQSNRLGNVGNWGGEPGPAREPEPAA